MAFPPGFPNTRQTASVKRKETDAFVSKLLEREFANSLLSSLCTMVAYRRFYVHDLLNWLLSDVRDFIGMRYARVGVWTYSRKGKKCFDFLAPNLGDAVVSSLLR